MKYKSVQEFLRLIEREKRKAHPDRKQMKRWLRHIEALRFEDDYRETYTGQDAPFMVHVSTRTWRDDC